MPTTATQVINFALDRLGVAVITTLGTDGTPQDDFMNRNYADIWKEVMRDAGVNPTRARAQLKYTTMTLTLSSTAIATGVTATAAAAIFTTRDVGAFLFEMGTGATGVAEITAFTSSTVVTVKNTAAWFNASPIAANAWRIDPLGSDYLYVYGLPSDFLKAIRLDDDTRYDIEGNRLLATVADAILNYWRYEDDPDVWDSLLRQAVIAKLAMEAAWPLTKNATAVKVMAAQYDAKLKAAKGGSDSERQPEARISSTTLKDVR